ncbi:hypothetical protein L218DRAFT_1076055 [Marasmius fiardii PR-910]|nr:hypothetical protein L218DRAFT_1076055 [Marasmius fiardii PR-910]
MDLSSERRHSPTSSTPRKSESSSESRSVRGGEYPLTIVRATRKSKVMTSVRRSLSVTPKKSRGGSKRDFSSCSTTTEERTYTSSRLRRDDPSLSPPTIEQIAMGLHLSRTPHLRGSPGNQYHTPPGAFPRSTSLALPPPPTRSAMKNTHVSSRSTGTNPGLAPPSASSTTATTLSTPHSSNTMQSMTISFKSRMSRLLVGSKSTPSSLAANSPRHSISDMDMVTSPKKAVRFFVDAEQSSNALDDE